MSRGAKKSEVGAFSHNETTASASPGSWASLIVQYSLAGHDANDFVHFVVFETDGALIEAALDLLKRHKTTHNEHKDTKIHRL